ncbi:MAG: hypothetical protein V4722_24195 [Bacteroidota bacterium]
MKLHFVIILLLQCNLYAQAPRDLNFYLAHNQVSVNSKDFCNGKFDAWDDEKTNSIIDSLQTRNDITRPFYIYLVSKILDREATILSASFGALCKNFAESYPDFLMEFLFSKSKMNEKRFLGNWSYQLMMEFLIDCPETEKQCIQHSLQQGLKKCKPANQLQLKKFYTMIQAAL